METLDYRFEGRTPVQFARDAVLVGVLASGNLEILLEPAALDGAMTVRIVTAARGFGTIWQAVIADFAQRLGLSVHRLKLAPGAGVSLAPFADAHRLVDRPSQVKTLDADALDEDGSEQEDERDVLGELEITARLMITGGEDKEEQRLTRADRSLIRQSILNAAHHCALLQHTVLTEDVRDALRAMGQDLALPESRRVRLLEMADAMELFCQGSDGELFNRDGTPWPEADVTLVDLATYAREGYNATITSTYEGARAFCDDLSRIDAATFDGTIDFKYVDHLPRSHVMKGAKCWKVEEIVTYGMAEEDAPLAKGATHLSPQKFHEALEDPSAVVIDVRNANETLIGRFAPPGGAEYIDPRMRRSTEFPAWVRRNKAKLEGKKILMYCTGGVRCERASAYLRSRGVTGDLCQLSGGIHRYQERFGNGGFFRGRCYVFDPRMAVGAPGEASPPIVGACRRCGRAWDAYGDERCDRCRMRLLVCDSCDSAGLVCELCDT